MSKGDYRSEEVKAIKGGVIVIQARAGGNAGFRHGEFQAVHKAGCRDIRRFHRSWKGPIHGAFYYDTVEEAVMNHTDHLNDDEYWANITDPYMRAGGEVDIYPCCKKCKGVNK